MKRRWGVLGAVTAAVCILGGCQPDGQAVGENETDITIMQSDIPSYMQEPQTAEENRSVFQDDGLRGSVCMALGLDEGISEEELLKEMSEVESLELGHKPEAPIKSLADLKYMPNLKSLDLSFYSETPFLPTDLTGIEEASGLEVINIYEQELKDLSFAGKLPKLKELYLIKCNITDISGLEEATGLERLSLYGNQISDATPLGSLINLVELSLNENGTELNHYDVLSGLTKMQDLGLSECGLLDIAFVNGMPELKGLNVNSNRISDLSPLRGHGDLERLGFRSNLVTDIAVLAELGKLFDLAMDDNRIEDISAIAGLKELTYLGISDNPVTDISVLKKLDKLFTLNLGRDTVKDITPLMNIPLLTFYFSEVQLAEESTMWEELAVDWIQENHSDMEAYVIEDICTGDLNRNGVSDMVFVYSELLPDQEEEGAARTWEEPHVPLRLDGEEAWKNDFYYGERYLIILLSGKDGSFRQLETDIQPMGALMGGVRGDPYRGMLVADGYLAVQEAWGSRSGATETVYYKYRKGGLEQVQINSVGDDNFAYGYDVCITRFPSGKVDYYAYALDRDYNYVPVCLNGLDQLKGVPRISLYNGSYNYFEEPRETSLNPEEALERVKEELVTVLEELEISLPLLSEPTKVDIGYPSGLKKNLELLKGVSLPDYYYQYGEEKVSDIIIYYNMYGMNEKEAVHEILINYWNSSFEHHSVKSVYVSDTDGTVFTM